MAGITIKLGLDTADVRAGAQKAAGEIKSALDTAIPQAQAAGRRIGSALSAGLSENLRSIGNALSVGLSLPLAGVAAAAIKSAKDVDRARQTITALTGSVEAANKKLAELRQLSQTSPGVTASFAQTLFAQFKALGGIADESINRIIKSIGRLNAVFTLPDPQQFVRNLQQIFTQGFERADIKEALGQVPIFEQLIEQAFGTKDPEKLRKLKEAGQLTITTWLDGLSGAIANDKRFANVTESIGTRFEKLKDQVLTALAPLGESLLRVIAPAIDQIVPKIVGLLDAFAALPAGVQEAIVGIGIFAAALGPVLVAISSLIGAIGTIKAAILPLAATFTGAAGGVAAFVGSISGLLPVIGGIVAVIGGAALAWSAYSAAQKEAVRSAVEQAPVVAQQIQNTKNQVAELNNLAKATSLTLDEQRKIDDLYQQLTPLERERVKLYADQAGGAETYAGKLSGLIQLLEQENKARMEQARITALGAGKQLAVDLQNATGAAQGYAQQIEELQQKYNDLTRQVAAAENGNSRYVTITGRVVVIADELRQQLNAVGDQLQRAQGLTDSGQAKLRDLALAYDNLAKSAGMSTDEFVRQSLRAAGLNVELAQTQRLIQAILNQLPTTPTQPESRAGAILKAGEKAREEAKTKIIPTISGGGRSDAVETAKRVAKLQEEIERDRVDALNRIWRDEAELRISALRSQLDEGLISLKKYYDEKQSLESLATTRELATLKERSDKLAEDLKDAKLTSEKRLEIERELVSLYAQQASKVDDLNKTLLTNFEEYKKRVGLPTFDLDKQTQEEIKQPFVDPLIQAARDRIKATSEAQIATDTQLVRLRTQQLEVENAIELGLIGEADGRRQINAILREQRDIQIAILEAQRQSETDPLKVAQIEQQIANIRTLGVELTGAQRFMRGFGSAIEDVGDIWERFGNNISRALTSFKGLFDNLKNAVKQFFADLVGNSLQRLLSGVMGSLFGNRGSQAAGGGGLLGSIGGSLFGGGGGGGGLLGSFGGFGGGTFGGSVFGGGGGGIASGISSIFLGGGFGGGPTAPGVSTAGGSISGGGGQSGQGGLGGLLNKALGGLLGRGAGGGFLASLTPLIAGAGIGSLLGGQSTLGRILGGIGGAAAGLGVSFGASVASAGGSLGAAGLAALGPIAFIAAPLLFGAWLLGKSKQRKADEEQSGVWLQAAVDGILALKESAKAGQVDAATAKAIFENQILATFIAQINTLKTKSVRESRLTNQVRDLRALFEREVTPVALESIKKKNSILNLIPEFATGGIVGGVDRGIDSVLSYLRPGEMILTTSQQDAIKSIAGPGIFARVGVPNAPQAQIGGAPAFASGGIVPMRGSGGGGDSIQLNLTVDMRLGKEDATRMFVVGASSSDGRRVIVGNVKRSRLDGGI